MSASQSCPQCGGDVAGNARIFCSKACVRERNRVRAKQYAPAMPRLEVMCAQCGKTFLAKQSRIAQGAGRFCSRACADASRRVIRTTICKYCGCSMTPTRSDTKFCSVSCASLFRHRVSAHFQTGSEEEQRRRACEKMIAAGAPLTTCPYGSGAIKMPDGGRYPDNHLGF